MEVCKIQALDLIFQGFSYFKVSHRRILVTIQGVSWSHNTASLCDIMSCVMTMTAKAATMMMMVMVMLKVLVTMVLVVTQFLKEGGTVPPPFNIIPTLKVTNIIVTIILPPDYNLCNKHRWHLHNHHLPYHHLWPSEE